MAKMPSVSASMRPLESTMLWMRLLADAGVCSLGWIIMHAVPTHIRPVANAGAALNIDLS
jgi:hypothetical protein